MVNRLICFLLFLPLVLAAQTTDTKDIQVARQKLQIGTDAAKYFSSISQTISVASTHSQSPTAKAVWDLLGSYLTTVTTDGTLSGNGTSGSPLKIAQQGASTNQVLKWNGTTWAPDTDVGITGTGVGPYLAYWVSPNVITAATNTEIIGSDIRITDGSFTLFGSSGAGNLRVFSDGTKGDVQTFGSVPLYLNRQGNDVYIPTIAGAGIRMATVANSGLLGSVAINDNDASNELQNLSLTGQSLGISSGTGITLPVVGVSAGTGMTVTTSSGVATVTNSGDLSTTNEIQALSTGTNTLTLSVGGGTVTVDTDPTNDLTTSTTFAGDVSGAYNNLQLGTGVVGAPELASTAVTAGTYGSGIAVPVFTVDADGRITGVSNTSITAGGSNWTVSGSDIYRNSNVAIGATSFAGAKLNVENLGSSNIGLRLGGGSVPSFGKIMEFSGNGTGAYSAINSSLTSLGNVIWRLSNEATTSGANSLVQVATGGTTSGGDPMVQFNCNGGNYSVMGIDNSVSGDPFKLQPYSSVGGGTYGLTMTSTGKFGITDETPEVTLDMAQNTDGVALPGGATAARPSAALPGIVRYNSTFGGLEYRNGNGAWPRISCTSAPSFTFGNACGTGSTPLASSTNDMGGTISVNNGTSPVLNGTFVTVTFGQGYGTNPNVTVCAGNEAAANAKFYISTQSTTGFTVKVAGTLTANIGYILRYTVTN